MINMKDGQVVFQGKTARGLSIIIRYPKKTDLTACWQYINALSEERTFLRFQGEQISLAEEKKWLERRLEKISKNQLAHFLVFSKRKLVASADIEPGEMGAERHVGLFGISVAKRARGQGIGKLVVKLILEEARKAIPSLKIITLGVFASNQRALSLYKKFGFVEYGRLPKGIVHREKYIDYIHMYRNV